MVFGDRYLRPLALWAATANVGIAGYFGLIVIFLVRDLHLSEGAVGATLTVGGLGGVLGALTARRVASRFGTARTLSVTGAATMPAGMLIAAAGPGARLALAVLGVLGLQGGLVLGRILLAGFQQQYVPRRILARVRTSQRILTYGVAPPAALLAGALADTVGARLALLAVGAVGTGLLFTGPFHGLRDLPRQPPLPEHHDQPRRTDTSQQSPGQTPRGR